jgi:hypothetical protein
MANGDANTTFNLLITRGLSTDSPDISLVTKMGPRAFVRSQVVYTVINGLFSVDAAEKNRRKFNVFYLTDPSNVVDRGFRDPDSTGSARAVLGGISLQAGRVFNWNAYSVASFIHESGHAVFALTDEYPCQDVGGLITVYEQPRVHGNVFLGFDQCTAHSENPAACRFLTGAPNLCRPTGFWSKSDPETDVMNGSTHGNAYGPDCVAQISAIVSLFPCPGGTSSSCN